MAGTLGTLGTLKMEPGTARVVAILAATVSRSDK
jgi:hypothetical protein